MRAAPRELLMIALLAAAGATLGVALLDYLAYQFAHLDLMEDLWRSETKWWRRAPPEPSLWGMVRSNGIARAVLVSATFATLAAAGAFLLARVRRIARLLLAVASCGAVSVAALIGWATWEFRTRVLGATIEVAPDVLWLQRPRIERYSPWQTLDIQHITVWTAAPLTFALALALVRYALRRGHSPARVGLIAAALALPLVLATSALALLWHDYVGLDRPDHDTWVALVQTARWLLVGSALVVVVAAPLVLRDRPRQPASRLAAAAGLLALGIAAVLATAQHRLTIDTLYPLREPNTGLHVPKVRAPWAFQAPAVERCANFSEFDYHTAVVRLNDAGEVVLVLDGRDAPLSGPATIEAFREEASRTFDPPRFLVLLAERRVPVDALVPFIAQLPQVKVSAVVVAGVVVQRLPSAAGTLMAWDVCAAGDLQLAAFARADFAPGTSWGAVVDDPNLVSAHERR
ncbi:hypothetical protein [Nannocystis radixulma]|uniref:ILEI/PANDER domain-containing protein n=1 Tax=Nannocystis radixulma TaxID=2995305 RepID=A0ABT5BDJ5_9BACT|nr:hypothetical protein [Nannocystis radixulma]MDC0672208.1 hypothetical protein [Nannocystis radixulma]